MVTNASQHPRSTRQESEPSTKTETKINPNSEAQNLRVQERNAGLLQQTAQMLIRQAAEEAALLDDRRSSAKIQAHAADALWNQDTEYARKLFVRAFDRAITNYREGKDSRLQVAGGLSISRPDIRLEILAMVTRRDLGLGEKLREKYVSEKARELEEERGVPTGSFDSAFGKVDVAAGDLLKIAELLLDVDQNAAFGVAQRAFASGIPQAAGYFFALLSKRNRPAADHMYRLALGRLRQDSAPVPGQLLLVSAYPFGDPQVWIAGGDGVNSYRLELPKNFVIDNQLVRMFLEVALTVLTRTATADLTHFPDRNARLGSALFAARLLEPKVAQFHAAILPEWRMVTLKLLASAGDRSRVVDDALQEVADARETSSAPDARALVQQLLERAEGISNSTARDNLYRKAASAADRLGDSAWALEIADKISDLAYRDAVRSELKFSAATRALKERRFDDAHKLALEVAEIDQQVYVLLEIARAVIKDKDRAGVLLEEAAQRATAAPKTTKRLCALIGISHLYAAVDSVRSFEIANEAIRTANKVLGYDSDQAQIVRATEGPGEHNSSVEVIAVEAFDLLRTLQILAGIDFDRTLGLAQSLESKPLRLASIVAIGASVMEKKVQRWHGGSGIN